MSPSLSVGLIKKEVLDSAMLLLMLGANRRNLFEDGVGTVVLEPRK